MSYIKTIEPQEVQGTLKETCEVLQVREVMSDRVEVLPEDMPLEALVATTLASPASSFPLVNRKGFMTGIISHHDLRPAIMYQEDLRGLVIARDVGTTDDLLTVFPHDDLCTVFERFAQKDIEELPVVDPREPRRVVGMVSHKDVLAAYNRELLRRLAAQGSPASGGYPPEAVITEAEEAEAGLEVAELLMDAEWYARHGG